MKSLILILMMTGVILIAVGYIKTNQFCPPPKIEYRYVPRTFEQEQNNPIPIMSVHGKMFKKSSPFEGQYYP